MYIYSLDHSSLDFKSYNIEECMSQRQMDAYVDDANLRPFTRKLESKLVMWVSQQCHDALRPLT